jgi:arginine/serine-rich splicing factor 4/5/6
MATRLFVGKLPEKTSQEDLTVLFSKVGSVAQVDVKSGYGFVYFENPTDAHEAVVQLNGHLIDEQPIVVEHARTSNRDSRGARPAKRLDLRIVVTGMDSKISWQDLKDWARQAGDVTFTNVYSRDEVIKGIVEFAVRQCTQQSN